MRDERKPELTRIVSIRLPLELAQRLEARASKANRKVSDYVRLRLEADDRRAQAESR